MSVLLVDGDNLLSVGFHGMKNYFFKGRHIGGIFYVLNSLRRMFDNYHVEKIVIFWDGFESANQRKEFYPDYKMKRKKKPLTPEEEDSYENQKNRLQMYMEEIFVRQGMYEFCESDDCIGEYVKNSNEEIIIMSGDGDLTQLVSDKVKIFHPVHNKMYEKGDKYVYKRFEFPIENIILIKMLCGDDSDSITGLANIGIKRLTTFFPEILEKEIKIDDLLIKSKILNEEKSNWVLKNINEGICKDGIIKGNDFYERNKRLIILNEPFLTKNAKEDILNIINEHIDPDGRSYKNVMKLMMEDGIHLLLPKVDTAWVNFLTPFLKLTRKEKNKQKRTTFKIKKDE